MNFLLSVCPTKEKWESTRSQKKKKEEDSLPSAAIEPTTSGFALPTELRGQIGATCMWVVVVVIVRAM